MTLLEAYGWRRVSVYMREGGLFDLMPSQNSGELARMIMNRVDKLISFDMKIKGRTLLDIIELYITRPNHANDSISFAHI
jgi:hypothetical protein